MILGIRVYTLHRRPYFRGILGILASRWSFSIDGSLIYRVLLSFLQYQVLFHWHLTLKISKKGQFYPINFC